MGSSSPPSRGPAGQDPQHIRQVQWTAKVGLAVNLLLAVVKFAGGVLGASQAVVADAVHSLSDSITDVAILIGVKYWSKPPDEDHPHGHRRIETIVTSLIGLLLGAVALGLVYNAVITLRDKHVSTPGAIAIGAAFVSIVLKELLYQWTVRVGRGIRSSAVVANAWHHRSDAFSSIPALAAVALAWFSPSLSFVDHIGAVVVSFFILQAAWSIAKPALGQLADEGASAEDRERIERIAMGTNGVKLVHAIRTRHIGSGIQVDLHVKVDPEMTVRRGHDISELVKERLLADGPDIVDVVVHLEPFET